MKILTKTNANNKILNTLIFNNCLSFGRSPKLTNRKINHYLFGTRQKFNIFKLQETRYLLLKVYPLIHNLFLQTRLNIKLKKTWFWKKNENLQTKFLTKQFQNKSALKYIKTQYKQSDMLQENKKKMLPPKILFATTTPIYSEIVSSAAKKCQMPFHVNRWLSGAITGASRYHYMKKSKAWFFSKNSLEEKKTHSAFQTKFFQNKKDFKQQESEVQKYQMGRKPTLIIIPDIANNEMILKETNFFGIPALGLVNSQCTLEISYPIFANDISFYSVHFFCHFLSSLILKEFLKNKHKIYTKKKKIKSVQFKKNMQDISNFNSNLFKLKKKLKKKKNKEKTYFQIGSQKRCSIQIEI